MRKIPPSLFAVAAISFLLPFVSFECGRPEDTGAITVTGLDLALGSSPIDIPHADLGFDEDILISPALLGSNPEGDPEIWGIVGGAAAVGGLLGLALLRRRKAAAWIATLAGTLGLVSVVLLRLDVAEPFTRTGLLEGLGFDPDETALRWRYGWWMSASAFAASTVLGAGLLITSPARRRGGTPGAPEAP